MLDSKNLILFFKKQIDQLRINPKHYISILQNRLQRFNQKNQYRHYQLYNINFKTQEGPAAVKQAISKLQQIQKNQKCLKKMELSYTLCQAAYQVGLKMAQQQHQIIHDFTPYILAIQKAIQKHAKGYVGDIKMILQYGFRQDKDIIPNLIIDDGDIKRTRRNILFDQKNCYIGISVHQHFQFDYLVLFLIADIVQQDGSQNGCSSCSSCQIM